jgi:voltage-gated potassium channel
MDPASLSTYQSLDIDFSEQVSAVILLRDSDVLNVYTALTLRHITHNIKLLSILHEKDNRRKLELAGIHNIVYAQEIVGILSREYSGKPIAFETMNLLRAENSSTDMIEIVVDDLIASRVQYVSHMGIRKHRLILIGISKIDEAEFLFNPPEDTEIHKGDILVVVGEISMLDEFRLHIHKHKRFL